MLLKTQLACAPVFLPPDVREKSYKGERAALLQRGFLACSGRLLQGLQAAWAALSIGQRCCKVGAA